MQEDRVMKNLESALRRNPGNAATLISKPENQAALARHPAKIMALMAEGNETLHQALKDNVEAIYEQSEQRSNDTKAWILCLAVITAETDEEAQKKLDSQKKMPREFLVNIIKTAILASPARREMFEKIESVSQNLADTIAQAKQNEQEKVERLIAELSIIESEDQAVILIENNTLLLKRHPEVRVRFQKSSESDDVMVANAFKQIELFDVTTKIDSAENVDAIVEILSEHTELYEEQAYHEIINEAIAAKGENYAQHFDISTFAETNSVEKAARDIQLEEWGLFLTQQLADVFKKNSGPNPKEADERLHLVYDAMSGSLYDILNNENEGPTLMMNALQVGSKPMLQQLKAMDFFKDKEGSDWDLVKRVFEEKMQQAQKESPRKFVRGVVKGLRSAENTPTMGRRRAESSANSTRTSRASSVETETVTVDPSESRLNLLFANSESPGRRTVFSVLGLNVLKKIPLDDVVDYAIKNPQRAEVLLKHFDANLGKRPDLLINLYEAGAKDKALLSAIEKADLLNSRHLDGVALHKALPIGTGVGDEWAKPLRVAADAAVVKKIERQKVLLPMHQARLDALIRKMDSAYSRGDMDAGRKLEPDVKELEDKVRALKRAATIANVDSSALEQFSKELKDKKNAESVRVQAQRSIVDELGKIQHKGLREALIQNFTKCMESGLSSHLPTQVDVEKFVLELNKQMAPTKGGLFHHNFVDIREITLREPSGKKVPVTTLLDAPKELFPSKESSRGLIKELPLAKQRERSPETSPKGPASGLHK